MGVRTGWIIDPKTRTGRECVEDVWIASKKLSVPGTPIWADLTSLFQELGRFAKRA
jgi:hypothetical protein